MTIMIISRFDIIKTMVIRLSLTAALILFIFPPSARALFSDNLGGNMRLTATRSNSEGLTDKSLNQEYTIHWNKILTPYLQTRASFRYFNLGVDQNLSQNAWREEYQPAGEIFWMHPDFTFGANIRKQVSTSNNETTDLIRDDFGVNFSTKNFSLPIFKARFDWDHTYNANDRQQRDTREKRFQAGLDYTWRNNTFYYNLARRINTSESSPVDISEWQHLFRWNQSSRLFSDRLRLSTGYSFNFRSQTTTRTGAGEVYTDIPFSRALYAYDPTPDLGTLDTLNGLFDGNIDDPALPAVDIGEGQLDRNIGVDFGIARRVSGIYLYTDRPSSAFLGWRVYVSEDNLTWEPLPGLAQSDFNMSFDRYEILFDAYETRYIKLVNYGVNDVPQVYVTEIQTLDQSPDTEKITRRQSVHLGEMGAAYDLSDKINFNADFSYRGEPKGDFTDSRNQVSYGLGGKHEISSALTEIAKYSASFDDYKASQAKNRDASLSYSLLITPLPTLDFSFAALTRSNYINGLKTEETNNLFFQTYGRVLTGLNLSGEITYSRSNRFDSRTKFDTWNGRLSGDTRLTRALDMAAYFQYQHIKDLSDRAVRIRRQYNLDFNYRMTRSILIRGSLIYNTENSLHYFSQEYSINWVMSSKLTAGALLTVNEGENLVRSERNNVRINYSLSTRSTLYLSYSKNSFTLAGRSRIETFQIGLKMGF